MSSLVPALDETIMGFRVATQRPAYRQRLLDGSDVTSGIAALRVLRSVERLTETDGVPSIRDVANDLGIEHSTASRTVESLVRSGLVQKGMCSQDQRQARLDLTARGRHVLASATSYRQQLLASLIGDWSEEDVRTLTLLLERLRRAFDDEFGRR